MKKLKVLNSDPYLEHFQWFFDDMQHRIEDTEFRLTQGKMSLFDFALAHEFFGMHYIDKQWVFREWAPNANAIYLIGDFSNWRKSEEYALQPIGHGRWEIRLAGDFFKHCDLYRLFVEWNGGAGERLPAYVRRCVQDDHTKVFSAQIWKPQKAYQWKIKNYKPQSGPLLIYEAHVGMAQEEGKIGSYLEFKEHTLPRIVDAGYNTIQLMGIQEHPYYGSFGYQVSNFFAPSSRFGSPEELQELIDACHAAGLNVLLDLVHSHAVKNELEGLSCFDGSLYQYFHDSARGEHPVWDSRLFNYGKIEVLHFLLSNVKYWLDCFKFDGFRFDGVTSMLYLDHGLGEAFTSYDKYFCHNTDRDALCYLALANKIVHEQQHKITIAEDVSGLPGLAASLADGGFGFDYRLAMGVPDFWTKTLKQKKDEEWHVEEMYHEVTNRRNEEKTISYAESHDQALVGDQTISFRLLEKVVYDSMKVEQRNHLVERGLALHCMIRLITFAAAGHGYLNFMGNEFGHPEWIDFPREGNNWSFHHARRMWHLRDNPELQYHKLAEFDKAMIALAKDYKLFKDEWPYRLHAHYADQIVAFVRSDLVFIFNFNPAKSFPDYAINAPAGKYDLILNTDHPDFGGNGRLQEQEHYVSQAVKGNADKLAQMQVYIPSRTGLVLRLSDN